MSNKRVLVTGASRGIGRAIALRLAQDGWTVAIHYAEQAAAAEELSQEMGAASGGVYRAELSIPTNAPKLLEQVLTDGPLHAVVNNAGVYRPLEFLTDDEDAFDHGFAHTFAVNFEAPLRMTRAAARHFSHQGGGKILNVASRVGFRGEPGAALYAASKAALINLTRSLAVELAKKDVGMFGIAPGWVETAMVREGMTDRLPEVLAGIPLGRMASPEDCAATASFLLSDAAAYLSGVVIDINGASYFH
ncbi:MAG: SDR family NAD(P)-dependent oxidoreductase [Fimbriimonas sp.]